MSEEDFSEVFSDVHIQKNGGKQYLFIYTETFRNSKGKPDLTCGKRLPNEMHYEGYPQYENGVGMATSFMNEAQNSADRAAGRDFEGLEAAILTGELAYPLIAQIAKRFEKRAVRLSLQAAWAKNTLFGPGATVAGLVSGKDAAFSLSRMPQKSALIPSNMLNSDELFLDGLSVSDLEKITNKRIAVAAFDGSDLLEKLWSLKTSKGSL